MAPTPSFLDVKQRNIPLYRFGSGEPLLYLHGLLGDLFSIESEDELPAFHRRLGEHFQVIAPAHPGFADAAPALQGIDTLEDMIFHYMDFLEELNLPKVNIVAHSLGGWFAAELATRCNHSLGKLVLINPCGLYVEGHRIGDLFKAIAPRANRKSDALRDLIFHEPDGELALKLVPDEASEQHLLMIYRAQVTAARVGWSPPYLHSLKLRSRLYRIKSPTLVIWGDQDKLVPPQHAEAYAEGIPDARVLTIPESGHCVVAEKPEEAAQAVLDFLSN